MAWENLPMRDRATIIKLGVQSGLRDINSIKETYNKFADGGKVNRKFKWDKVNKGTTITNPYGKTYYSGDNTRGLFQQADDNSWTPVSVEQARDIYVPNVTDTVSNSYTQLGPMPTLTVTSPDWETVPYNVEDTRFGGRTPITNINVRRNKNTGKILPEDYRQVLAIKDWYAKQHPKSDPSENFINDLVFTAATLGANKNVETATKGISSLFSNIDPIVKTSFREGIAKPMLLGSLVDQTQKAITGTSLSDQIGSWLTNDYGWNPYVAHFIGDLTNTGYTMPNFTGQFLTKGIINPIITGISNTERSVVKRQLIRELNKSISKFDGTVGKEYFRSPYNWYRVTESPEIESLKEAGYNITTKDLPDYDTAAGRFYNFVYKHKLKPGIGENEGYFILPKKENKTMMFRFDKFGSAHGNTSQAAKGELWGGTFARSKKFPGYVLEGRGQREVPMGINRSHFVLTPWEEIPMGQRIGFHTKEMPMEGLNMFRVLPNGRYKIEGELLPDKRIFVNTQEPWVTGDELHFPTKY